MNKTKPVRTAPRQLTAANLSAIKGGTLSVASATTQANKATPHLYVGR